MTDAVKPQVWAGVECSHLQMGDRFADQLALTGHRARIDDIDRLASLGVTAVRYPVLWGWPAGRQETDWEWAARRLRALTDLGIRPVVGLLHHGYGPAGATPLDPEWPAAFARYAGEVARRFPSIDAYLPINEPLTTSRFAGLYGWWPPYGADRDVFVRLMVAQCLAIRAAIHEIRLVRPEAQLIVNEDGGKTYGTAPVSRQAEFDNERHWLTFDLLTGRLAPDHPLWAYVSSVPGLDRDLASLRDEPIPPDVLGIDYYVTSDRFLDHRLDLYPVRTHGGNGRVAYADVELARVDGRGIDGFTPALRETWERYRIPVALTEVDLAGPDPDKVAWWLEAWRAACDAGDAGIPVAAVTAWSVFGSADWATMLRSVGGAYEPGAFDVRVSPPRRTPVGRVIAATALRSSMASTGGPGWWRRPERVLYGQRLAQQSQRIAAEDVNDRRGRQPGL